MLGEGDETGRRARRRAAARLRAARAQRGLAAPALGDDGAGERGRRRGLGRGTTVTRMRWQRGSRSGNGAEEEKGEKGPGYIGGAFGPSSSHHPGALVRGAKTFGFLNCFFFCFYFYLFFKIG